jgi:hypothetical protein
MKLQRRQYIVIGVVGLVCLVGIRAVYLNKRSPQSASTQNTTTASQLSEAQQVGNWWNKYGYINTTIENDSTQISKDASNYDYAAMAADCQKEQDDLAAALSLPAIPDAAVAAHFSSAITYYQTGDQECVSGSKDAVNGTANSDVGLLNQAASEISASTDDANKGIVQMQAATTAIKQLTGN